MSGTLVPNKSSFNISKVCILKQSIKNMQSMQEPLMESLGGMITLGKKMKMFNFWFIFEKVIHFFLVFSNFLEAGKQYQEMRQISCECHNISGVSLSCPIAMSRCFVNSVSSQCSNATKVCFLKNRPNFNQTIFCPIQSYS